MQSSIQDPSGRTIILSKDTLHGHIYRRHREMQGKKKAIIDTLTDPDYIAKSKKDEESLLYFKQMPNGILLMVVTSPEDEIYHVRTSFYVLNTSKGDPIIWQKKTST